MSIRLLRHPQTPVPPYHYDHYEVTFSGDQRVKLKGTVTVPFAAHGVPGVVLVVGSSPADRDYVGLGATPAHRPYAVLADYLSRHGIAVLRYDERGVSRSEGDFWNASAEMLVTDVGNAVRTLASRPGVDSAKVGVIGHSAGALLAVKLLAMPSPASFGMALSMPTSSGVRYASSQIEARARHRGIVPLDRAKSVDAAIKVNAAVLKAAPTADASMRANAALASVAPETGRNLTTLNTAAQVSSGLYRYMLMHDPIDDLRRVVHPLLVVEGGSDRFVEGRASIGRVNAVRRPVYLRTCFLPKVGHDLRDIDVQDGKEPEEKETISNGVLFMIEHWIKRVVLQ